DVAVLVFDEDIDHAVDMIGSVPPCSPLPSEALRAFGFPKATSRVHYDAEQVAPGLRQFMRPEWERLAVAIWIPAELPAVVATEDSGGRAFRSAAIERTGVDV